jgi:NCS1 family nucleobase:cation symporter-1
VGHLAAARGLRLADLEPVRRADLLALWARPAMVRCLAVGFDIAIAMPLSWLPLIADYSRFGKRAGQVFGGTAVGFFIGNFWLMASAWPTPWRSPRAAKSMPAAGAGRRRHGHSAVADPARRVGERLRRHPFGGGVQRHPAALKVEHLALAIGVLCTLIAWLAPLAQYQNFLLIGSVFAPLFGVVLVDHFLLRRRAGAGIRPDCAGPRCWPGRAGDHLPPAGQLLPQPGATLPALLAPAAATGARRIG